jgi:hypothetical protein
MKSILLFLISGFSNSYSLSAPLFKGICVIYSRAAVENNASGATDAWYLKAIGNTYNRNSLGLVENTGVTVSDV